MVEMNHRYFLGEIARVFKRGKTWFHCLQKVNVMGYNLEMKLNSKLHCYWFHGQPKFILLERMMGLGKE